MKWEYKVIRIWENLTSPHELEKLLNPLGKEGWAIDRAVDNLLILKRQIATPEPNPHTLL